MKLGPAAPHFRHLPAIAVHGAATSALLVRHGPVGDTSQHRQRRDQQQEDRSETGEPAHFPEYIPRPGFPGPVMAEAKSSRRCVPWGTGKASC